jgi:ABC-type multidrug transport system ATPase subunit
MDLVTLNRVHFRYNKKTEVLNDLDLNLRKGSCHGFLGHNGAGKTTTLRIIMGLLKPENGTVSYCDGFNKRNNVISYMPEYGGIYERLSVGQNIVFRGEIQGLTRYTIDNNMEDMLSILGLQERLNEKAGYLSQGLKRRLSLACAMISNPELLILDEPTNGIDPVSLKVITDTLRNINSNGTTILISSHNLHFISQICGEISIIQNGKRIYNSTNIDAASIENLYIEKTNESER